jgi:hypothetical protein
MREYHKIETVFNRSTDGDKRLIWGDYRNETVEYLADNIWQFTEKIDGTNIRIHWDGHNVEIGGRTDRAQIPKHLMDYLSATFLTPEVEELFEQTYGEKDVMLFGEGYGAKIQNGGDYRSDVSFILFDVLIGDNWQSREWVEATAKMFNVDVVPIVLEGTIGDGIDCVMQHNNSTIGKAAMEGVVGRPKVEMKDRLGNRIIVKIKWKDFKNFVE